MIPALNDACQKAHNLNITLQSQRRNSPQNFLKLCHQRQSPYLVLSKKHVKQMQSVQCKDFCATADHHREADKQVRIRISS